MNDKHLADLLSSSRPADISIASHKAQLKTELIKLSARQGLEVVPWKASTYLGACTAMLLVYIACGLMLLGAPGAPGQPARAQFASKSVPLTRALLQLVTSWPARQVSDPEMNLAAVARLNETPFLR
jgi:hypothetical protein